MKIGILTYHRAENFGAIIQSYALSTYLRNAGYEVELIDFRCGNVEMQYDIWNPRILWSRKNVACSLKDYLLRFSCLRARRIRKKKFADFRRLLPMSERFCAKDLLADYDVVIVGSDQVWNFHINCHSENVFLLDLKIPKYVWKIAYAASAEREGLQRIDRVYLTKCLQEFRRISVREVALKEELKHLLSQKIEVCADPVFLLDKDVYERLCAPCLPCRPYVLAYHMTYSSRLTEIAGREAANKNMQLVELYGGFNHKDTRPTVISWGPRELLTYIANAETVYTTSFHGLAMSLIMEKNVWVYDIGSNSRQKNLLSMAGLECRLLSSKDDYCEHAIDFKAVKARLMPFIDSSKDFLNFQQ